MIHLDQRELEAGALSLCESGFGLPPMLLARSLAAAGIGTWRINPARRLATWNEAAGAILGRPGRPQHAPVTLPVHPDDLPALKLRLARAAAGAGEAEIELRVLTPSGGTRWLRCTAIPQMEKDGWITAFISDITVRKHAEAQGEARQDRLLTLVDNLQGIVFQCSIGPPWRLTFVSDGVAALTGYRRDEVLADGFAWDSLVHPEDLGRVAETVGRATAEGDTYSIAYRLLTRHGHQRWVLERGRAIYDARGEPMSLEGFVGDISEQKQAEERASWIATHDSLTLLPNRLVLQERVEAAIRSGRSGFALILIDVDEFKRVNDSLGHDAGDALLCTFAKRLRQAMGPLSMVARLGGDEFACLVEGVADECEAEAACAAIAAQLTEACRYDEHLIECRASLGASLFPQHGASRAELLKHADLALYAAKAAGKGNFKIFEPRMRAEMQRHVSMLSLGRDAIKRGDILPYYQPKIDLGTGALVGFEALLRWHHPVLGLQLPDSIAACFEDPLLGTGLSDAIIAQVIADMTRWREAGLDFGHVAVNAATADFQRGDYGERMLDRLAAASIPPQLLQVEVTETVFLGRSADCVEKALRALHAAGIRIALDDFGTGYASLSHLKQFPVDLLKIDRSFINDLDADEDAGAIVRAVINMARSLGLQSVAEGVETQSQAIRLRADGCDQAQGFLYSRGVPASAVPDLLRRFNGAPAPSSAL